jgi:hypothetical protein
MAKATIEEMEATLLAKVSDLQFCGMAVNSNIKAIKKGN